MINKIVYITFIYLKFNCIFEQESLLLKNQLKDEFKKLVQFYSPIINLHAKNAELNVWRIIRDNITFLSGLHHS